MGCSHKKFETPQNTDRWAPSLRPARIFTTKLRPRFLRLIAAFSITALGSVWWIYYRSGPAAATAASTALQEATATESSIDPFLSVNHENIQLMRQLRDGTHKIMQNFPSPPIVHSAGNGSGHTTHPDTHTSLPQD